MGWFKQHMIEVQEKGFDDINKEVCSKFVGDIAEFNTSTWNFTDIDETNYKQYER